MDLMIIVFGCLCICFGVGIMVFYQNLKRSERGGFSFKLRTAGIGLIIIGIGLIVKSCN